MDNRFTDMPYGSALIVVFMLSLPILVLITYNVFLHPLSHVPGPWLWATSRLPYVRSLIAGTLVQDVEKLHNKYGSIVRVAPNEVTFAHPESFHHIFHGRPGHEEYLKDPTWWWIEPDLPDSLFSTIDPVRHADLRKVFLYGFTSRALREQEVTLQKYVALLISRLDELITNSETFDIVPWINFAIFDIFGDLAFAESFDCLRSSRYHSWIAATFNQSKMLAYSAALRFYPGLSKFLNVLIPRSLRQMKARHMLQIMDKAEHRLNLETDRPDLMHHIIKHKDSAVVSDDSIKATFISLVIAGSDTSATVLCGITNYLLDYPSVRDKLSLEIRAAFKEESEITMQNVQRLVYLNCVISEGLRLCPPVPFMISRVVPPNGDDVCGIWLPGGTSVSVQAWTLFRHDSYFFDAKSFIPERWLMPEASQPGSKFEHDKREAVQPFSMGPTMCLGKELAWAEMRLVLARLLWRFDLERGSGERVAWEDLKTYVLVEKKPIHVKLTRRN